MKRENRKEEDSKPWLAHMPKRSDTSYPGERATLFSMGTVEMRALALVPNDLASELRRAPPSEMARIMAVRINRRWSLCKTSCARV
jgi:hypothetical protein